MIRRYEQVARGNGQAQLTEVSKAVRASQEPEEVHTPIPKAKATMAPILDILADGREHLDEDIQEEVARFFRLTKSARERRHSSGIPVYKNRTAWGLVYLQDPKHLPDTRPYIEKTDVRSGQEVYRITAAGVAAQRDRILCEGER